MEHSSPCKKCGHLMADHGKEEVQKDGKPVRYTGYCANGNDGDCKCKVKGDSYEEALEKLNDESE